MSRKRRTVSDEPFLVVRTSTSDHGAGGSVAAHRHDGHQLIHVRSGLMAVRTGAGSWVAPPAWAVWVPAGVEHAIRFVGASALRTCYLRPGWRADLPGECRALAVSPLLRELIARATELGMLDSRVPAEAAVAELIAGELGEVGPPPFSLPEPTSAVTIRAAELAGNAGTAALARAVGVGTRTLERRFRAETGMTLGRWRQQRMLLRGLEQVAAGASVKTASAVAGYGSPSAFIAAFRRAFDATPSHFFQPTATDPAPGQPPSAGKAPARPGQQCGRGG
jgi:AraC-like DNA-binding protein